MKIISFKYEKPKNTISYEEYYFNGIPIPNNIEIIDISSSSAKISWNIDNLNILNFNRCQFIIEIKKENENFKQIFESNYENKSGLKFNYTINNLEFNTNYEVRIKTKDDSHSQINIFGENTNLQNEEKHKLYEIHKYSEWSKIKKFKTLDYDGSIILKECNKEKEFLEKLKEWCGFDFKKYELLFRGTRDGINNFFNKCNNKGPTFTLIKNEKGDIFGGYASVPWEKGKNEKNDSNSFLFNFKNSFNISPVKFPSDGGGYAVRNYKNEILENINYFHGPCFGWGTDLGTKGDVSKIFGWTWIGAAFKDVLNIGASILLGILIRIIFILESKK